MLMVRMTGIHGIHLAVIASNSLVHNSTLHMFNVERICKVGLHTELFYAIIPTLFPCFLLIYYPYVSLHFQYFLL